MVNDKPDRVLRNVEDVDYAETDGNRPMREVLRDRKAKRQTYKRKQLDAAYRKRAGMIGDLASCICCYPLVLTDTPSQHEPWCPTDQMRRSYDAYLASLTDAEKLARNIPITTETKGNRP